MRKKGYQLIEPDCHGIVPIVHITPRSYIILNLALYHIPIYMLKKWKRSGSDKYWYGFRPIKHPSDILASLCGGSINFMSTDAQHSISNAAEFASDNNWRYHCKIIHFFEYASLINYLDEHYPNLNPENAIRRCNHDH